MLLWEKYEIEANAKHGRVGYKVKDREKHITERALGSHYGLACLNEELTIADSNVTEILAGREKVYTLGKEEMLRSDSGNRAREENTL